LHQPDPTEERNKKFAQWSMIGAALLAITLVAVPAMKMRRNNRGQLIEIGQTVYQANCQSCHGIKAVGQDPKKPRGGRQSAGVYLAPALDERGSASFRSNRELFEIVKNGSLDPKSPMKGMGQKLDDEKIAAVLVYIQSLWTARTIQLHQENSPNVPIESTGVGY